MHGDGAQAPYDVYDAAGAEAVRQEIQETEEHVLRSELFFEDGGKVPRDVDDAMDVVLVRQEIGKQITKTAAKLPVM